MANFTRNFIAGRMNKTFDERVVPDGEYIDAMNVRMGSTEKSEAGVIENTNGNLPLTQLTYIDGTPLSQFARCIGAIDDSARETLYWFVHDPNFLSSPTSKLDLIVSYNVVTQVLTYHVVSVNDGGGINTTLNFNPSYLITGVNIIEDLLFFTDDYNEPRFINIKKNYADPDLLYVDYAGQPAILAEALLVVKKPPVTSPTLKLLKLAGQENFLEDRFICFAYRYKYSDGEYSATSQWTEPAFFPKAFQFSEDSFLNEGMENQYNGVEVYFNTGGPLVVGIDLLFKEASSNVIKVIEKFDKQVIGWGDNTTQYITFSSSKIFTILPESELLRLYDNVPRYAKAQTIMGNRLMYGNYVDGYDLIDKNGFPVNLDYVAELVSNEYNIIDLDTTLSNGIYNIDTPLTVPDSILNIDLSTVSLIEGYSLTITVTLKGVDNSISPVPSNPPYDDVTVSFSFPLNKDYSSVYQLATSQEFIDFIGTVSNIQPVVYNPSGNDSCDGNTVTDIINCAYQNFITFPGPIFYRKEDCGINGPVEPIQIIASPSSSVIGLQFLAAKYEMIGSPGAFYYVYFQIIGNEAYIDYNIAAKSLHSNRDYEIGIVYMDEFNRSTPANVSSLNTVHIPCSYSPLRNSITVTIPPSQIAPYWAKRYKFVCKADQAGYETIYSNIWFLNPSDQYTYFLLQGENARKVENGDRYIVKADTNGPLATCAYATVLEKQSYASSTISTSPPNPAGVYMKMNTNDFSSVKSADAIINPGRRQQTESAAYTAPILSYPMSIPDPLTPGSYIDITLPAGSVIIFDIYFERKGFGNKKCETRTYKLQKTYTVSTNYQSVDAWFNGDNIAQTLNSGIQNVGGANCPVNNVYIPTLGILSSGDLCNNYWQFYRDGVTQELVLQMSGTTACSGASSEKRKSRVIADIIIYRAVDTIIFETEPLDTLPDVFFENELSFPIDQFGNHLSNGAVGDVNQNIALGVSGVIQTGFFNCFTFGNGAESYKIRDSIIGRDFNLGNRVTTVAAQDYREERRFADITYSGVYNPETNVNKLNEFNQALLNYKNLELSFGAIYILDGRETDVLVLQEDKVSYVLAGKNLLSDAAAGGAITSVPEVLGTQIARTEKYGISFNPESYVQWGYDRFFTDAKRGAVIQLKGNAYSNEQLTVISEQNMRTWFRDTFIETFNTQKLGGFDPYMNEYVLTINDREIPQEIDCSKCGIMQTLTFAQGEDITSKYEYCVNLGFAIGDVVIEWNVMSIDPTGSFDITATYDSIPYTSGPQTTAGSFNFFKGLTTPTNVDVDITVTGNLVLMINVRCPEQAPMTLVEVVWTNDSDAGQSLMKQFNYINPPYISPLQSNFFIFSSGTGNPLVSYYLATNGFEGSGIIPVSGSTMTLQTNETFPYVTFNFNPLVHKFRYARTGVLYGNNDPDMQALLGASTIATPIVNPSTGIYNASFTVPPAINGQYMYIIWDLRQSYETKLCYSNDPEFALLEVCCNCQPCEEECSYYIFSNPATATQNAVIEFPLGHCFQPDPETFTITLEPDQKDGFCLLNVKNKYVVLQGEPVIYMESCYCPT